MLSITQIPPESSRTLTMTAREYQSLPVTEQFKRSFSSGNRLGLLIGAAIGSFVPVASYILIHGEAALTSPWLLALVLGALLFSALSVFGWASAAFHSGLKAAGFCVLVEGTMVLSHTTWLLVIINVACCSCALQVGPEHDPSYPSVTPSIASTVTVNVQQNAITPAPRQSTGRPSQRKTDEERKAADARRSRKYRERKRLEGASRTSVTMEGM
jgi:hypothetical protein